MTNIDLDAIRARDAKWHDRHPLQEGASRDRRMLLQHLDELEQMVEDLALDIKILRSHLSTAQTPQDAPNSTTPGKLLP